MSRRRPRCVFLDRRWRAAEGRRRRAEQQFDWQEAARARGLAWDARGTDSSDFDEPQGAHRHH